MFGRSKEKKRKTRKEKRDERKRRCQLQVDLEKKESGGESESGVGGKEEVDEESIEGIPRHVLDVSAKELKDWQASDESLKEVRETVEKCEAKEGDSSVEMA